MNDEIVIGALMHDIGKFSQRAGERLTEDDLGIESTCCPSYKGRYTHRHVLYSGKFIRECLGEAFSNSELVALFHHQPHASTLKKEAMIVAIADRLSSGERISLEDDQESGQPKTFRMRSVFTDLTLGDPPSRPLFFPVKTLNANMREHFSDPSNKMGPEEDYQSLWLDFKEESQHLSKLENPKVLIRQLLSLLEKYTLFIPSAAYRDKPDISLFHHQKSTAAIASCLMQHDFLEADLELILSELRSPERSQSLKNEAFYLIGGDLSGIQNFIYSVAARGALKGLRGRSFYLQLLAESVVESFIEKIDLNPTCTIYCSGGHFYLLAPKTESVKEILRQKYQEINRILVKAHNGKLNVNIFWQPLSFLDFLGSAFGKAWDQLGAALAREKRRKVWNLLELGADRTTILGPFEATGEDQACVVCGEHLGSMADVEEKPVCSFCKSFESLAYRVARANYLLRRSCPEESQPKDLTDFRDVLGSIGCVLDFAEESKNPNAEYILNKSDFLDQRRSFLGFRFFGKHAPLTPLGDTATLEDLAEASRGISKWGALRADVDSLGNVFRAGLSGENRSVSRLSMLSHMISLYFSSHIQFLLHQDPFRKGVSLIYSGGDDLFALGAWSMMPDLAKLIYDDFRKFTGGVLSLSAGLFLGPSAGYPVYQAAAGAGEEEKLAKHAGRNRFSIFGTPIPWDRFAGVEEIKNILADLMKKDLPRSVFSMLYAGWEEQALARKGEVSMFRVWKLFYGLRQLRERKKDLKAELMELEGKIVKDLYMPDYTNIAVRWAEYLTRGKEE